MESIKINTKILILFGAGLLILVPTVLADPELLWRFAREDSLVEYLTAAAYFVGMIACGIAIFRGSHRRIAVVWLLLCFVFLGEEVSWFQRVLGYSVPAIETRNVQGEFNFHNFDFGKDVDRRFFDENGTFHFQIAKLLNTQNIFRAGLFVYFLLLPLAFMLNRLARRVLQWWHYLCPSPGFIVAIWSVIAVSFALVFVVPELARNSLAEIRELYYAAIICLYTWMLADPARLAAFVWSGQPADAGAQTTTGLHQISQRGAA